MILINSENSTLRDSIVAKFECEPKKRMPCSSNLPDFDDVDVQIKIEPEDLGTMFVELHWRGWNSVRNLGGSDLVRSLFPEHLQDDSGNKISLQFSLDGDKEQAAAIAEKIAALRSDILSSPLQAALTAVAAGQDAGKYKCNYQLRSDTQVYIVPGPERCTVIFGVEFAENTDRAIARIFMNSFQEAKRLRELSLAPICTYSPTAPLEIREFNPTPSDCSVGFLSFVVQTRHMNSPDKVIKTSRTLVGFRNYLQYHVKCSKAFFHSRMRARVASLLQVLNRAKTDADW